MTACHLGKDTHRIFLTAQPFHLSLGPKCGVSTRAVTRVNFALHLVLYGGKCSVRARIHSEWNEAGYCHGGRAKETISSERLVVAHTVLTNPGAVKSHATGICSCNGSLLKEN